MNDEPDLDELTDTDVRYVAVVWDNGADASEGCVVGPRIDLGGCSEFEAVGLLRAALKRLERVNAATVRYDEDEESNEEDA